MSINPNKEWNFVRKEIISSNKGGTPKGRMLFEFQVLLFAFCKSKNLKEKLMLSSIFQERKSQYYKEV